MISNFWILSANFWLLMFNAPIHNVHMSDIDFSCPISDGSFFFIQYPKQSVNIVHFLELQHFTSSRHRFALLCIWLVKLGCCHETVSQSFSSACKEHKLQKSVISISFAPRSVPETIAGRRKKCWANRNWIQKIELSFTGTLLLCECSLYVQGRELCGNSLESTGTVYNSNRKHSSRCSSRNNRNRRINEAKVLHKREPFKLLRGKKSWSELFTKVFPPSSKPTRKISE